MNILKILKRDFNLITIAIFIGSFLTVFIITTTKGYSYNIQKGISKELIRFHVLANSDEPYDQELKVAVKDAVIEMLQIELDKSTSLDETRILIIQNLDKITDKAIEVITTSGYSYDVSVKIAYEYFPTKTYGDVTLPSGEYECLKIEIGEAKGANWWCVMFPPLCFVDASATIVPDEEKKLLKKNLTTEEYDIISNLQNDEDIPVKVKFKIVEVWQDLSNR